MLNQADLKKLLSEIKSIAIVGAKDKPGQPVNDAGIYLEAAGYRVFPVHPKRASVWGKKAYPSLAELPEVPDAVVLFRASEYCADHAREVLALPAKPKLFWMQLGIVNDEAMRLLAEAGIPAVQDACIYRMHEQLFGSGIGSLGQGL